MNRFEKTHGFTVIELLVVIGIVGILTTAAAVSYTSAKQDARNTKRQVEARTILDATLQYQLDHDETLPSGIDATPRMIGTATTSCDIACNIAPDDPIATTTYPVADAYIYQYSPNTNFGTESLLHVYPWAPSWTKRAMIRFDVSNIPSDASISSARVYMKENINHGYERTIAFHRLTRDWSEESVSWNMYDAFTPWTQSGGDYSAEASAQTAVSWNGILEWNSWDVTSDIQSFVNGTFDNYGWIIKDASEDSSEDYWYFPSRESAYSPYLIISFTPDTLGGTIPESCLDLSSTLGGGQYVSNLPTDPLIGSSERTYYVIKQTTNQEIMVRACGAEGGETITARGA